MLTLRTIPLLIVLAAASLGGCKKESESADGPMESAGEEMEEMGDDIEDGAEEAGDEVEDALD